MANGNVVAGTGLVRSPAHLGGGAHCSQDGSSLISNVDETKDQNKENEDPSRCSSSPGKVEGRDMPCTQVSEETLTLSRPKKSKKKKKRTAPQEQQAPPQEQQASPLDDTNSAKPLYQPEELAKLKAMISSAERRSPNTLPVAPAPNSLNSILRQHPRTRLFVSPKRWTSLHLELLCTSIVDYEHPEPGPPRPAKDEKWQLYSASEFVECPCLEQEVPHLFLMLFLLWDLEHSRPPGSINPFKSELYFRYGHIKLRLPVKELFYDCKAPSLPDFDSRPAPSVAVVDLRDVARRVLGPVRYQKGIQLEKWEPYILGVLIALACGIYCQQIELGGLGQTVRVHVINYSEELGRSVVLYSADVPFEFVLKFLTPSSFVAAGPLEIRRTRVWFNGEHDIVPFLDKMYSVKRCRGYTKDHARN